MKFTLIVPTKDRPEDIKRLFATISFQSRKPDQIIVVDGSDNPVRDLIEKYSSQLPIQYIPCRPPSLPKQRNVGIAAVAADTDWVGFLDDDLVLEYDALEHLENFIKAENNPKLKGIGLCILNQISPKMRPFLRFFLMSDRHPGKMTNAGFPTAIPFVRENIKTDWLYGGATFWSRDIFENFKFDEWFFGTGYMEDIDFSYRISRNYELMVSYRSRCNHYHHQIPVHKEASIGEWQMTSWWYFIKKHKDFPMRCVAWGMMGLILKSLLAVIVYRTKPYIERAKGHFRGVLKILKGQALDLKGFTK